MSNLPTETTKSLRRNFSQEERLKMGSELAAAHNQMASIAADELVMKTQIKNQKAVVELTIEKLSQDLNAGFSMESVKCNILYGVPNPLEVSIARADTGEVVEVRAMAASERQKELPLAVPPNEAAAEASAEQSATNVVEFFGKQDATAVDQPEPIEEASEVIDAEWPDVETPAETASDTSGLLTFGDTQYETIPVGDNGTIVRAAAESKPAEWPAQSNPSSNNLDELLPQAVRLTIEGGKCSASVIQRELAIGYARAVQLINLMEQQGVVGPGDGSGKREVLKDMAWLAAVTGGAAERHPADAVIAPKDAAPVKTVAEEHKDRVAKTFKPKALRESGFKAEDPKLPEDKW